MSSRNPLLALLLGLALAAPALAEPTEAQAKKALARLGVALNRAKDQGVVGETWQGFVDAVKAKDLSKQDIKKLIDGVNLNRRVIYNAIAKRNPGMTPERVGEAAAVRNYKKAKKGAFFKAKDGRWVQKK